MNFAKRMAPIVLALLSLVPLTLAQPALDASGHWVGTIQAPDGELSIEVDMAKNEKGEWIGTISVPKQNLRGLALANITIKGNAISFAIKGIPGEPTFQGTVSADAKSSAGDFTQGGVSMPFKLARTGDAKIEAPAKSTPISKELEGTWEGALDVNGKLLRLVLKMSNQPDGTASGSVISVDQGGAEIPITTITQKASNLKLEINVIGGSYSGDLNKEGTELAGQWTQGPGTLPLTFKRPAKPEAKK